MHIQFANKKILITAGATRETIDNNTYISNTNDAVQEYAFANYLLHQGAQVILVTTSVSIDLQHPNLQTILVNSALEMDAACCLHYDTVDIAVFGADVAKYRAEKPDICKQQNKENTYSIKMIKNIDIAYEFGKVKKQNQMSVGITTTNSNAITKAAKLMDTKNFDIVIAKEIDEQNTTQQITIIDKNFSQTIIEEYSSISVAKSIANVVENCIIAEVNYNKMQIAY